MVKQCLARLDEEWYNRLTKVRDALYEAGGLDKNTDYAFTRKALKFYIGILEDIQAGDIPSPTIKR
jgi:hypothetical protein